MGLIDLSTATSKEAKAEAIAIINHIPSETMARSICSFARAFYKYYDRYGWEMFLAESNGELPLSHEELEKRVKGD